MHAIMHHTQFMKGQLGNVQELSPACICRNYARLSWKIGEKLLHCVFKSLLYFSMKPAILVTRFSSLTESSNVLVKFDGATLKQTII